jgi:hypothetical protein
MGPFAAPVILVEGALMRISREYFFDLCELIGKAITTARKKQAGPSWNMDEQLEIFFRKWEIDKDEIDRAIRESARDDEDRFGLFEESGWKDSAQDGHEGAIDERENRREYSKYGSEKFEQRKAQRCYNDYGDSVSSHLWHLMREVRFKETRVVDALKELQRFCSQMAGYISAGWGHRLAQIIDQSSP